MAFSYRLAGRMMQGIGFVATLAGAAGLVVAAALPWATLRVFGVEIAVPGVIGFGLISASIGLALITQFAVTRRFPILGIILGITSFYIGQRANTEVGKMVRGYILRTKSGLSPINTRLTQADLPSVEPFGEAVGPWRDYTGPGPLWTEYAGATVTAGSLLLLGGGRLRRTCRFCKRAWSVKRGDEVAFCPHCGKHSGPMPTCPRCAAAIESHERFCVRCGENLPRPGNFRPTP